MIMPRAAITAVIVLALLFVGLVLPVGPVAAPDASPGMGAPVAHVGLPPEAHVGGLPAALATALRDGATQPLACLPGTAWRAPGATAADPGDAGRGHPPLRKSDPEQPGTGAAVR